MRTGPPPPEVLAWLASLPPSARDAAIEERLGIAHAPPSSSPGEHLVGYHASGVAPIVRALMDVPVTADDVVIDLGSGLGKVVMLAHLLTGARSRGVELQPALVARARHAAKERGMDVSFTQGDARDTPLDDGTVFFLYVPFLGPVLAHVIRRLYAVASRRAIVVCALGFDVHAPWLSSRPTDAFWLTVYDSTVPGAQPRSRERSRIVGPLADAIAHEREHATSAR